MKPAIEMRGTNGLSAAQLTMKMRSGNAKGMHACNTGVGQGSRHLPTAIASNCAFAQ